MSHFDIFADYFSFIIQDERAEADFSDVIDEESIRRMIVTLPGAVYVTTARDMDVPVDVNVVSDAPVDDLSLWDKINECSIDISSGKLVLLGGSAYFPDAPRITVNPGIYGVRVYYKGLDTISDDGLNGDDAYRVVLWPISAELPLRTISPKPESKE